MAAPRTPSRAADARPDRPRGDPWHAVGHLVAGVALYGLLGFGLDRLLGTSFLVAIGIVVGAVLGLYATWKRFMSPTEPVTGPPTSTTPTRQETD